MWLHLTAAAVWVGSQLFLGLVVAPSLRALPNQADRVALLTAVTRRYGYLGWVSLAVIALTGLDRVRRTFPSLDLLFGDGAYSHAIAAKLALGAAIMLLTAVHTWVVGPRLLRAITNGQDARSQRRTSLVLSTATLLASLAVLWIVAGLHSGG